ncbi:hypothetical protein G6F57_014398 [Rhizopus arrhizus]|nr:hypothetical protein G6F57_014398 [Rhizopus arrhizus]
MDRSRYAMDLGSTTPIRGGRGRRFVFRRGTRAGPRAVGRQYVGRAAGSGPGRGTVRPVAAQCHAAARG